MSIDRIVLIIVCAVALVVGALWLGGMLFVTATIHPLLAVLLLLVAALAGYILIRVITDRTNSAEDDHYDKMDH